MGAAVSCPQDFDTGIFFTCRSRCPPDFKYTLSGTGSTPGGQCIYLQDNSVIIDLPSLPGLEKGQAEPPVYAQERTRFAQELAKARAKIAANIETRSQVGLLNAQRAAQAADYTRIQTEYAGYASSAGTKDVIQDVSKSLTPFRPPTAPASDIEIERKAIAGSVVLCSPFDRYSTSGRPPSYRCGNCNRFLSTKMSNGSVSVLVSSASERNVLRHAVSVGQRTGKLLCQQPASVCLQGRPIQSRESQRD